MTDLAGIAPLEPGYRVIRLRPHFHSKNASKDSETIFWVKAHHDSPHGRISVSWKRLEDDSLTYEATIPPNTTAQLTLPTSSPWNSGNKDGKTRTVTLPPGHHSMMLK